MKTIPSVPDFVTREQYDALIESLGFELKDLLHLEFRMDGIYAEMYSRGSDGRVALDRKANTSARHRVHIPVRD